MSPEPRWPRWTQTLPGTGGAVKASPEDFVVEELPAYLPSGEGEHLFLWVEKRALSTPGLVRAVAAALELAERDVSYAGLKDQQAVTRQWLCVPARVEPRAQGLAGPSFRVHRAVRHRNKLKTGHLSGNRFAVRVREAKAPEAAAAVMAELARVGLPNYYGEQRFGADALNAHKGRELLLGRARAPRFQRRFLLSALQSELFNEMLAQRVREGALAVAREGDVLKKTETGGEFVCTEPQVDQLRVDSFEVSPAGPMFGPEMTKARGAVERAEATLLAARGLTEADFERGGELTRGARRPYRVRVDEPSCSIEGRDLLLGFVLPSGSYATVLLDEVVKGATPGR